MFSLHFRQWSVKLSLFSPTIVRQSPDKGLRGEKRGEKGSGKGGIRYWSNRDTCVSNTACWNGKTTWTTFTTLNNASRGHRLFEAHADQGLLVAKQQNTTLRLWHISSWFLLALCPREGSIHGTRVVFCCLPLQQDCNTRSVQSCKLVVNVVFVVFSYSAGIFAWKALFSMIFIQVSQVNKI